MTGAGPTVLVTGAGGAAAVTLIRALSDSSSDYNVVAADIDPLAVGLYLVPAANRLLLPRGDDPEFVNALLAASISHGASLVIPTVDSELLDVSQARARFAEHGIGLLVESVDTLRTCLDKYALIERCSPFVRVPATVLLDGTDSCAAAGRDVHRQTAPGSRWPRIRGDL